MVGKRVYLMVTYKVAVRVVERAVSLVDVMVVLLAVN